MFEGAILTFFGPNLENILGFWRIFMCDLRDLM
jgi:hypothetical protein